MSTDPWPLARISSVAVALPTVLGLMGCERDSVSTSPPPVEVVVAHPIQMPIVEWDEYVGRLEAIDDVEVRSRVSGYLESIHFAEGQIVKAGDLLFVIDAKPFVAEVKSAEAAVAEAEAQIAQAEAGLIHAEAERRSAESRRTLARSQLDRAERLLQSNSLSQEDYDIEASEAAQAEAEVAATGAQVESARATITTANAAVQTAKARLQVASINLSYTRLYAPISGRMSRHVVTEGNLISGGSEQSTLLTTIVSLDPIHCYFDADEQAYLKYTRLAREGKRASSRDYRNPVFVALADEKDEFPHKGHMDFVDNRIDSQTGTMRARAILSNPDLQMVPGLFVRLRLPGSGRYEAILIPDYAISLDQSEKFVFVVDGDSVRRRIIETGPIVHGLRVVRSGLKGEDSIVIEGIQRLRSGSKITTTSGEIALRDDEGLPDNYEPVPRDKWLGDPQPVQEDRKATDEG